MKRYWYVQAVARVDEDGNVDAISFRHTAVSATDEMDAYTKGQRVFEEVDVDSDDFFTANDYVFEAV